jgi:hypothetical protein
VTVDDDDARWLVGDASPETGAAAVDGLEADDLAAARQRRLSAVGGDEPAFGDDAIEMVSAGESAAETTMELGETLGETPDERLGTEQPVEAYLDDESAGSTDEATGEPDPEEADTEEPDTHDPAAHASEPRRPAKKRGRASVPSWDEIMFGGGKND